MLSAINKVVCESLDDFGDSSDEDLAVYGEQDTGLVFNTVILSGGDLQPMVKFQQDCAGKINHDNMAGLSITDDPVVIYEEWYLKQSDLELAKKYKAILLQYWRAEIMTRELEANLKKV